MSTKLSRAVSKTLIAAGISFLLVALLANVIGLSHGSVGKPRVILGVMGIIALAIGVLGRRFLSAYKFTAVLLANLAVMLLSLEAAAVVVNRYVLPQEVGSEDVALNEVYDTAVGPSMYLGFKGLPHDGDSIHVGTDRLRVTPAASVERSGEPLKVFTFGGSTMWGEGASDDETIAAYLQTMLCERTDQNVVVTNFGQRAWVSSQGLVQLVLSLRDGNVPDVVVFYDGYNEVTAAHSSGQIGVPENFEGFREAPGGKTLIRKLSSTDLGRLLQSFRKPPEPEPIDVHEVASQVLQNYMAVIGLVEALGREYGFATRFYWQPQLFTEHKSLTSEEEALLDHRWLDRGVKPLTTEAYRLAAELSKNHESLVDISDAFAGMEQRLYLDPCHIRGSGNKRVVEVMLDRGLMTCVQKQLEATQLADREPPARDRPEQQPLATESR